MSAVAGTAILAATTVSAQERTVLNDARLYVTAPLRWDVHDWLYVGGTLAALAATHHYDADVQRHFADPVALAGGDSHGKQDALPALAALAGTAALAWVWDDHAGYGETRNMLEAAAFTGASTWLAKQVVRRDRPTVTSDPNAWFKQGDSFPSMHVSVAMAIGAVLAESGGEEFRWVRRGLGYGLGVATAYARLQHQQHWLSDTVASAALGLGTARFILNRDKPGAAQGSLLVMPDAGGVMLSYSAAFR
jgi:PAP2 superfamily